MKRLLIIIPIVVIFVGLILILIFNFSGNNNYIVKVDIIDEKSPDRVLTVYKDNEKIEFDSMYYLDDVFICDSESPNVAKSALKNVKQIKVKLKNGRILKAKVEKEEK